jgi:integrase
LDLVSVEDAIVERAATNPSGAKFELEWFKRALKDARRRRQVFDDALLSIPPIRTTSREGIALELDELQWLGSWFPPHMARFPEIVGSVGWRIGEALSLTHDRIDLDAGQVFIPAALNKEGRDKTVELADFERALIAEQLLARPAGSRHLFPRFGGGEWGQPQFHRDVWQPSRKAAARELRERDGLPEWERTTFDLIVPHDLRHTAISTMAAGGMRPEVIAKRVGHLDGGKLILQRYRHLFPDEMGRQLAGYSAWRSARLATIAAVGS